MGDTKVRMGIRMGLRAILDQMNRKDHFEEVTLELRSEGRE